MNIPTCEGRLRLRQASHLIFVSEGRRIYRPHAITWPSAHPTLFLTKESSLRAEGEAHMVPRVSYHAKDRRAQLLRGVKEDFFDVAYTLNAWSFWRTLIMMTIGLTLLAVSINALSVPNHLGSSGATGLALTLFYLFGKASVGLYYWLINIPIILIGWRAMSARFVLLAVLGVFISGAALQLTRGLALPTHDAIMASVLAGSLSGFGVGLYLRFGGSAGGLDIVAALMRRRFGIPMGQTFIMVNAVNVIAAGILNRSLEVFFYTAIAAVVHSTMVDRVQSGLSARKAAFIITKEPDLLAKEILRTLNRGCTFFAAKGGMSLKETRVIYTVVSFVELARLKAILFRVDRDAFMAVTTTAEVIGNRFISWEAQGYSEAARKRHKAQLHRKELAVQKAELEAKEAEQAALEGNKTT